MILAMAARPLHGAPLRPRLRRASPSAAMVVASAKKLQRWRRRPSSVEDDAGTPAEGEAQDVSSAELEFLTALAAEPTPSERGGGAPGSNPPQTLVSSSSDARGGAPLRGLDVLQALQHKAAARRKGGAGAGAGKGGAGQRRGARVGSGGKGREDVRDYSNVRPLDIKSDWGARLDELDRLVQELQAQQHLYSD